MKRLFSWLGVNALILLALCVHTGRIYEFSPTTLQTRYVRVFYLPILHVPIYRQVVWQRDYMLCAVWKSLKLLSEKNSQEACWLTCLMCPPNGQNRQGPAYELVDVKRIGSTSYWEAFARQYPREAKTLFRSVIAAFRKGDVNTASRLLTDNAWLPVV
jgi:hypothetical protein